MKVFSVSSYTDPVRSLILAKINSNRTASMQLGELIWTHTALSTMPCDMIIPIPLHWTRYAYRGYNQAEIMASVIAKKSKKDMKSLLKRVRRTIFQSALSFELREENVKNVFALKQSVKGSDIYNKHIVLVDDLMTTGATLKAAAKVIQQYKPASISAVVACRTI